MRKLGLFAAILLVLTAILTTVACAGEPRPLESYDEKVFYNLDEGKNLVVGFNANGTIVSLLVGSTKIESKNFTLKNNKLTIKGAALADVDSGEVTITATMEDKSGSKRGKAMITAFIIKKMIKTKEDLLAVKDDLKASYMLGNDIDFEGETIPQLTKKFLIGEENGQEQYDFQAFSGIFDGNGYAIKNFKIDQYVKGPNNLPEGEYTDNYSAGLFRTVNANGVIRNLEVTGVKVSCQGLGGLIAGVNNGLIENCFASGEITSRALSEYSGGIAGMNSTQKIELGIFNCVTSVKGIGDNAKVFGIAGWNMGTIQGVVAGDSSSGVTDPETGKFMPRTVAYGGYYAYLEDTWYEGGVLINASTVFSKDLKVAATFGSNFDQKFWNIADGTEINLKDGCSAWLALA